jgi:uncharacterized protein
VTLTDANPLVALVDTRQADAHARCQAVLPRLSAPMLTTWPCFVEAMYLLYRAGGWPLQRHLWRFVETGKLTFYGLTDADALRMRELMEQYKDTPMDLADASLVVAAEALKVTRIFTMDSDFYTKSPSLFLSDT